MKKTLLLCSLLLAFVLNNVNAQMMGGGSKIIQKSGDLSAFKSSKVMNATFTFDGLKVGAYNSEEEFTKNKMAEIEKSKGKAEADEWLKKWEAAKKNVFPEMFLKLFNERVSKMGLQVKENESSAEYTLNVNCTYIEPGYNVAFAKRPAFAAFSFNVIKNADKSVVAELYVNNVLGSGSMGYDFSVDSRVKESYAKAGKMLGKFIAD
jgi:hypothetical protein